MNAFTAHRLRFVAEVQTTIEMDVHQGSAIRGAFLSALRDRFCVHRTATECAACPIGTTCPVAALVSTLKPGNGRGRDVPRPFTIQPPLPGACEHPVEGKRGRTFFRYLPGERFEFGLTLYARALDSFSHVITALEEFACAGIGHKLKRADGRWRPGTLNIREAWAENLLTSERQPVMQVDGKMIQVPDIPITHQQVCEWAGSHHGSRLALRFLTPTRLIEHKRLLKPGMFRFQPLFQRLMTRLESLSRDFSNTPLRFNDPKSLITAAGQVRVVENHMTWHELRSYSSRRKTQFPTSGLLGSVMLEADDWSPFLDWLAWGQFTHVGKNAVRGHGWYTVTMGTE